MTPVVEVAALRKRFYMQPVLDDVSFQIAEGEVFGYIGPNGAGKTTTLKILAGLITKYDGDVTVAGKNVRTDRDKTHALIGYLPQSGRVQSWRTVKRALDSLGALSGVPD